jgi:hypothetical protein
MNTAKPKLGTHSRTSFFSPKEFEKKKNIFLQKEMQALLQNGDSQG